MADWDWKSGGFRIDGANNTLVDISPYINNEALQSAITDLDTTGMGQTNKTRQNGMANKSIPLNGLVNSTTEAIFGPIMNGTSVTKTFEKKMASNRYYNGEVLPTNIQFSGKPDTLQLFSATLVISGAMNRTSVALV